MPGRYIITPKFFDPLGGETDPLTLGASSRPEGCPAPLLQLLGEFTGVFTEPMER